MDWFLYDNGLHHERVNWLEDTSVSSRKNTIASIIKKFAFHQSIKAIKKKFKIKSEFLFNHVSSETIKRIINECV